MNSCKDCEMFKDEIGGIGLCFMKPPVLLPNKPGLNKSDWGRPMVGVDDACGELSVRLIDELKGSTPVVEEELSPVVEEELSPVVEEELSPVVEEELSPENEHAIVKPTTPPPPPTDKPKRTRAKK